MIKFRSILFASLLAGLIAGISLAAIHQLATVPLILAAEKYENTDEPAVSQPEAGSHEAHDHSHAAEWAPGNGLERNSLTSLADVLVSFGFALVLTSLYVAVNRKPTWREGLLWGMAGFASFSLAPAIGLPPELPGMPAGDLLLRQLWWIATVLSTAVGIGTLAYKRSTFNAVIAIALVMAPHLISLPLHAENEVTLVPVALWRQFAASALATSLVCWLSVGALSAYFYRKFEPESESAKLGVLSPL